LDKYQKLFEYISYFENLSVEEVCNWDGGEKSDDGVMTTPYPIYDRQLTNFINEVYRTDLIDYNYSKTIGNSKLLSSKEPVDFIADWDFELLKAILTYYTRGEKFCDGFWASVLRDKVFYKILIRLAELEGK